MPGTDFPYLKKIYSFYGQPQNVDQVYLPNDHHDYGITKRVPMYQFFAKNFGLNLKAITDKNGNIDESSITIQPNRDLLLFAVQPLPANALRSHEAIVNAFKKFQSER